MYAGLYAIRTIPATHPQEAYEQNHWEIVDIMGQVQAAISASYRNDRPRTWELVGRQEEFKAMLQAALEFWRTGDV
ncbi:MAG: hypothetical protein ACJ8BW_31910 [Ktedonobacteraceae bacterium]